jgi:phenylalanyl-tRNA synthetase alpha chain
MLEKINQLINEVKVFEAKLPQNIEQFRIRFLGKKGIISELFKEFQEVPAEMKKEIGLGINTLKNTVLDKITYLKNSLDQISDYHIKSDLSLPGDLLKVGSRHPVSTVMNEIIEIFSHLGFVISEGPEIEDDNHVFSKLNFPPEHPARDMQDTFFIHKTSPYDNGIEDVLLRTHTSSVQVRIMEKQKPPIRTISPGRVFRNEAISARAHCIFHQVEGLYIDKNVSFADLKQTLLYFSQEIFGEDTQIRLRPSFFPFTEPSAEMDVICNICNGKGCNVCKYTGWLEVLGCGMVDPNVLKSNKIDPEVYTGFAFGMGVERIAMLKYQINDLRLYFENDIRFLEQFTYAF